MSTSLKPRPGSALVRTVKTDTRFPGSSIHLLDSTVKGMVGQQMELLRMGAPPEREDPEPWETETDQFLQSLPTPSWLLVQPWSYIEAGEPDTFFVGQHAILAVLR